VTAAGKLAARKPMLTPACLRITGCECGSSRFLCGNPPSVSRIGLKPEGDGTVVEVVLVVSVGKIL
jgi:hypothetical protein